MFDKLESIERRYIEIEDSLSRPDLTGKEFAQYNKERVELEDIVNEYRKLKIFQEELESATLMLKSDDVEMRQLAKEEVERLTEKIDEAKKELVILMLPSDPLDSKNVMLEIRAGTGGDEASIFVADLLRMYGRYAERMGWKIEFLHSHESTKGGYKEVTVSIEGKKVYSRLKFERGVHRVQRVPLTESQGRIHTSACTVAVLPEAEEVEVDINTADLRIDTYRSSGAGGQHVNTTDSAVRITHIPTGIVSECQDERSQHKNKDKAMKMLRSRIYSKIQEEQEKKMSADRKSQVGSGDRSERIRTYNFPQSRMTDHRINLTLYRLDEIMDGSIEEVIDALGAHHTAELLKQQNDL
ncbi:MAG: peptide chain release factor 1 [Zetaproteobacteria bacterium]|nr:peptide chain release factor 1 [Pseudobdellovibrionaceae bacterium]